METQLGPRPSERISSSALFFSDTHLLHHHNGAAHHHLKTLISSSQKTIYAVGDILDLEAVDTVLSAAGLDMAGHYPSNIEDVLQIIDFPDLELHLRVLDTLIARVDAGADVIYTPGNHDIALDLLHGMEISGIKIRKNDVYEDGHGRRFQVEHGHLLDPGFLQNYQGWYRVGSRFLDAGLFADNCLQTIPGLKDTHMVSNLLKRIGKVYVNGFVDRAMNKVKALGVDGIICGHIHKQAYMDRLRYWGIGPLRNHGAMYINCGDGLTHGTYVSYQSHGPDAGWRLEGRQDINEASYAILDKTNHLAEYRGFTMEFLQKAWDAHLESKAKIASLPEFVSLDIPEGVVV